MRMTTRAPVPFAPGRRFPAVRARGADGKVGFEFAPRIAKTVIKGPEKTSDADASLKVPAKRAAPTIPAKKTARKAAVKPVARKMPARKTRKAA